MIACRAHEQFTPLFDQVVHEHETALSEIFQVAIQRVEPLHALLLLCLWPIPQTRLMYDPSWNFVGLVTNAAMQLNFHNPVAPGSEAIHWKGFSDTLGSEITTELKALTWLGCFWIGIE